MTALWGREKHPVSYAENTKRSKKPQALGMCVKAVSHDKGGFLVEGEMGAAPMALGS
jgi:hypothetical protein